MMALQLKKDFKCFGVDSDRAQPGRRRFTPLVIGAAEPSFQNIVVILGRELGHAVLVDAIIARDAEILPARPQEACIGKRSAPLGPSRVDDPAIGREFDLVFRGADDPEVR